MFSEEELEHPAEEGRGPETVSDIVDDFANGIHGQSELRLVGEFLEDCLKDDTSCTGTKAVCLKALGWLEDAIKEARTAIEAAEDDPGNGTNG
jgi:hypothetical protein